MKEITLRIQLAMQSMKHFVGDEGGQDLIEYALVAALIALAATAGMTSVAGKISDAFTSVGTKLNTYTS